MKVLITGASGGIGTAVSERFLELGYAVYGIDLLPSTVNTPHYHHYIADVRDTFSLPEIEGVNIIFNNAGTQNDDDINTNLTGCVNVTEKYINPDLKSILFNASASSISGQEFPLYAASKAGVVGYMRNTAIRVAKNGITCNAISLGGVLTPLNDPVVRDKELWKKIMNITPLKKWMTPQEVADWVVFLTVTNRSMSGQNLLIDNGENDLNPTFVWPK